jgi:hypothetical protein
MTGVVELHHVACITIRARNRPMSFFFLTSLYVRRKVQKPAYFNIYKLPRPLALCGDVSMVDSEQLPSPWRTL